MSDRCIITIIISCMLGWIIGMAGGIYVITHQKVETTPPAAQGPYCRPGVH